MVAAQEVLDTANATIEQAVKKSDENQHHEENSDEDFEVGSRVKYVGKRESLAGKIGAVVEVKERGWFVIAWQGGQTKFGSHQRIEAFGEQPPSDEGSGRRDVWNPRLKRNPHKSRMKKRRTTRGL